MFNILQQNHWISATNKKLDTFDNNSIVTRSPSSNSTLSSHCTSETSGVAAAATSTTAAASGKNDELASSTEFQPPTFPSVNDDWENLLSAPNEEQTFLGWIMSNEQQNVINPSDFEGFSNLLEPSFQEFEIDNSVSFLGDNEKSMFNPVPVQNPLFYNPARQPETHYALPPNPKRLHSVAFPQSNIVQQQRPPPKPKEEAVTTIAQQQQVIVDQLFKAAELLEAGNPFSAREILARLNQQLPPSSLGLKPILRSAFIFKEVLTSISTGSGSNNPNPLANPWDIVFKLSSYKAFSEVSPLIHFTDFTCTQTLLEEIGGDDIIHIVDFDIKIGGQWSSFMQELAHRRSNNSTIPFLKITAIVSLSGFHPLELHLTRENLSHFARELNIPFEFNFLSIESLDPNEFLTPNESIAVNLPIGPHYVHTLPSIMRMVKQLNPKIVLSVDQGCDRSDLPFSHYFLHSFQSCMVLLDSIDAAGTNADVASKIEKFLIHPRVESLIMGRHRAVDKMPPWRAMYASAGFVQWQFSNFTETQAECLLKRVQVRGFHVEKRQGSMFLYWQRGELGSVSAWKC